MIFNDSEHRILLAALRKEEDFCKSHNENSIIPICKSIENKVSRLQNMKPYVTLLKDINEDMIDLIIVSYETSTKEIIDIVESCKDFFFKNDYSGSQVEYIISKLPEDCITLSGFSKEFTIINY